LLLVVTVGDALTDGLVVIVVIDFLLKVFRNLVLIEELIYEESIEALVFYVVLIVLLRAFIQVKIGCKVDCNCNV